MRSANRQADFLFLSPAFSESSRAVYWNGIIDSLNHVGLEWVGSFSELRMPPLELTPASGNCAGTCSELPMEGIHFLFLPSSYS
jgi:hypothetical protein